MLKIRLIRIGKRNKPSFRVVLTPKESATKSGKFIEILGSYDPTQKKHGLNKERINYWISKGAQCSDTVHNLLIKEGAISGSKRKIKMAKPAVKEIIAENKSEAVSEAEPAAEKNGEDESLPSESEPKKAEEASVEG